MSRKEKLQARLVDYIRSRYTQVEVKPMAGIYNYKCFYNAVEFSRKQKIRCDVYECIYIDGGVPILHYVNFKNGVYLETTLGYLCERYEYYILRRIPKSDHLKIDREFEIALDSWTRQFTTWFDRAILRIDRIL